MSIFPGTSATFFAKSYQVNLNCSVFAISLQAYTGTVLVNARKSKIQTSPLIQREQKWGYPPITLIKPRLISVLVPLVANFQM